MDLKAAFGLALKQFRKSKGLTQEDFAHLSSRTYLSVLERGKKSPTLDKISELSREMGVHPLSLVAGSCLQLEKTMTVNQLLSLIRIELEEAGFDSAEAQAK